MTLPIICPIKPVTISATSIVLGDDVSINQKAKMHSFRVTALERL
jgi:hypothetical protein